MFVYYLQKTHLMNIFNYELDSSAILPHVWSTMQGKCFWMGGLPGLADCLFLEHQDLISFGHIFQRHICHL